MMNKVIAKRTFFALFISMPILSLTACAIAPTAYLSVQVVDESLRPVEGVKIKGGFTTQMLSYISGPDAEGITDKEGMVNILGPAYFNIWVTADKEGYYHSEKKVPVNKNKEQAVKLLLRRKRNPIAMFAKHFVGYIPKNKTRIGFDFSEGDWVSPNGKGYRNDVYFYFNGYSNSFIDYGGELTISFPNKKDGLIGVEYKNGEYSDLKLPYFAPKNGYVASKKLVNKRKSSVTNTIKENNLNKRDYFGYFFRVRSEVDSGGKVVQANYVKIGGDIIIDPRTDGKGVAYIEMTYYYNPIINDRNLEFDPDQNLFRNLKHGEKVDTP